MDYEKLKEVIAKQIKENGQREITGPVLQAVLMAMVDSLGEVYPQTYTDEQKAQARANIDALSDHNGEITKEKLSAEVQAILGDVPNKQNITDATLATQAKTIVGAINELTNKEGLLFLGVLGPNDPAPSNEPTKGYYLSFQASTKETPYFNGVHLHRYCLLIWTQDETGRWKFKRVKYEDHRGPMMIVAGRALPIHYEDGGYIIKLSGDGTRDTYFVGNCPLFRHTDGKFYDDLNICISKDYGARIQERKNKYIFMFLPEDDQKVFSDKKALLDFLLTRLDTMPDYICSSPNYVRDYGNILWRPKNPLNTTAFIRRYYGMGAYRPNQKDIDYGERCIIRRANARLPFRVKFVKVANKVLYAKKLENKLYILRGARGWRKYYEEKIYCKGFSDNYEVVIPQRSTGVGPKGY